MVRGFALETMYLVGDGDKEDLTTSSNIHNKHLGSMFQSH
jgi:hypothetical protein